MGKWARGRRLGREWGDAGRMATWTKLMMLRSQSSAADFFDAARAANRQRAARDALASCSPTPACQPSSAGPGASRAARNSQAALSSAARTTRSPPTPRLLQSTLCDWRDSRPLCSAFDRLQPNSWPPSRSDPNTAPARNFASNKSPLQPAPAPAFPLPARRARTRATLAAMDTLLYVNRSAHAHVMRPSALRRGKPHFRRCACAPVCCY